MGVVISSQWPLLLEFGTCSHSALSSAREFRAPGGGVKAIETTKSGRTVGTFVLGERGGAAGSVRQQVHDGDTINVKAAGNFGVRFLGVDAPEISLTLPGETTFTGLSNPRWEEYLSNPFVLQRGRFEPKIDAGLEAHLEKRTGPGTATNHHAHATAAEDA